MVMAMGPMAALIMGLLGLGSVAGQIQVSVNLPCAIKLDAMDDDFTATPGVIMNGSPLPCVTGCSRMNYQLAMVEKATACFCGNSTTGLNNVSTSLCTYTCSDPTNLTDYKSFCGGNMGYGTVFNTMTMTIDGLNLNVLPIGETSHPVAITANVTTLPSALNLILNVGDGSEPFEVNAGNQNWFSYRMTGTYTVAVQARFARFPSSATALVRKKIFISDFFSDNRPTTECNASLVELGKPFKCYLSVARGTSSLNGGDIIGVKADIKAPMANPAFYNGIVVSDDFGRVYGKPPSLLRPWSSATLSNWTTAVTVTSSPFWALPTTNTSGFVTALPSTGQLIAVRAQIVAAAGTSPQVAFQLKRPSCTSGTYCLGTRKCETECLAICSSAEFVVNEGRCKSTSTGTAPTYTSVGAPLGTATGTGGYQIAEVRVTLSEATGLLAGDVLSATCTNCAIVVRPARPGETPDTADGKVALVSAYFYENAVYTLPGTCPSNGPLSLALNFWVIRSNLTSGVVSGLASPTTSPQLDCQNPVINMQVAQDKTIAKVNENVTLAISMDKGAPVNVTVFTNGTLTNLAMFNYSVPVPHTLSYPTSGVYDIIVRAFNMWTGMPDHDADNVTVSVIVQYPVTTLWNLSVLTQDQYILPANVVFQVEFTGVDLPTNASAVFDFGDGSPVEHLNVTSSLFTIGNLYEKDKTKQGNYSTMINMSNLVSNESFMVSYRGVQGPFLLFNPIENLTLSFVYFVPGSDAEREGMGPEGLDFPTDYNITCKIELARGIVEFFELRYVNGTTIDTFKVPDRINPFGYNFTISLPFEGYYNITIRANNSLQNWVESEEYYTLHMISDVKNVTLDDFMVITSPSVVKKFNVLYDSTGGTSCLFIAWGDGGQGNTYGDPDMCASIPSTMATFQETLIVSPFAVNHTYTREGVFKITVTAWNVKSQDDFTMDVTIVNTQGLECFKPTASVLTPTEGHSYVASKMIILDGLFNLNCSGQLNTNLSWSINHISDDGTRTVLKTFDLPATIPSWNKNQLAIPALYLKPGKYAVTFNVRMTGLKFFELWPIQNQFSVDLDILPTPLEIFMTSDGASQKLIAKDGFLSLSPEESSKDPDDPTGVNPIKFSWLCALASETLDPLATYTTVQNIPLATAAKPATDGGGCFGAGPGKLNTTSGTLVLNAKSFFTSGRIYQLYVIGQKDNRSSNAKLEVEISNFTSPLPEVSISCITATDCLAESTPDGYLTVAASDRLSLRGSCGTGCEDATSLTYVWSLKYKNAAGSYVAVTIDSTIAPQGWTDSEILLGPNFVTLLTTNSPTGAIQVRLDVTTNTGKSGYTGKSMVIVRPPKPGKCFCTVAKMPPTALLDPFTCSCVGWTDPQKKRIVSYSYYALDDAIPPVTSEAGSSANGATTLYLAPGTTSIRVVVANELTAISDVEVLIYSPANATTAVPAGSLTVLTPSADQMLDLASDPLIAKLIAQSPAMSATLSTIMATALLTSSDTAIDMSTMSADEIAAKMDLVSSTMANALTTQAGANILTASGAVSAASMLSMAVSPLNPNDPRSLTMSIGSLAAIDSIVSGVQAVVSDKTNPPSFAQLSQLASAMMNVAMGLGPTLVAMDEKAGNCDSTPDDLDITYCRVADSAALKVIDPVFPPADVNKVEPTDEKMIKCCAQAEERRKLMGQATTGVETTMAAIGDALAAKLVVNEVKTMSTASGAVLLVTSKLPKDLGEAPLAMTSKTGETASIQFPSDLPCDKDGCNVPLKVAAASFPKNILVGEGFQSNRLSPDNQLVSVSIAGMEVKDLKTPVMIAISLPSKSSKPTPIFDFRSTKEELKNSTIGIVYTVLQMGDNDGDKVSVAFESEEDISSKNLYILARRGSYPVPIKDQFDRDSTAVRSVKKNSEGAYVTIFEADQTVKGNMFFGLLELKDGANLTQVASQSNWDNYLSFINDELDINFKLKPTIMAASYFDTILQQWKGDGVSIAAYQAGVSATIATTHLTTFGTGFIVKPNMVDFAYVFANAGFADNLTIYLTLILTVVVYIILVIWARTKDKKDTEKLGSLPLPDNDSMDKYIYEILVQTGDKNSAETDSKVSFILSGDDDDTEVRTLIDPKTAPRRALERGSLDAFVLACPKPLGNLNFLRIWHDNSGKGNRQGWFLSYFAVRDVQTGAVYEFVCNDWLAVEKSDGQIDRLIPVSGDVEKKNFSFLFNTTSSKNLRDNHLWFSVFMRPARSRFTRVQRVSSCMALLYLSMLTNAMWYGILPDKPGQGALKFGPFCLSPEQIGVGFMSTLICFPPTLLIIQLFRKSRPRKLRKSRITEALAKDGREPDPNKKGKIPRQKKFTLPWWCRIIAWILVVVCFCVSIFFLWAYGIQFGNEKATKWVSSLIFSFFSSILVVEPIKILAMAAVFSLICKSGGNDTDDADEDEEDPDLEWDESYLMYTEGTRGKTDGTGEKAPKIDPAAIEEARQQRLNEMRMWSMIKEMLFYSIYLTIVVVLSYGDQDQNANFMQNHIKKMFSRPGTERIPFLKVTETEKWWNWTENVLLQELRAQSWYNGQPAYGLGGFLNDRANRLLGYGIIRQTRVKPDSCKVSSLVYPFVEKCASYADMTNEDHEKYCPEWQPWDDSCTEDAYWHKKSEELQAWPWIGRLDLYSGGGYSVLLSGRRSEISSRLANLKEQNWVNEHTRALFIEFSVYNAQVNLFAFTRLSSEMVPGGGMTSKIRVDVVRLLPHYEGFGTFVIVCEITFLVFTLYFTIQVARGLYTERGQFFKKYWNLTEVAQIIISYIAIGSYVIRMSLVSDVLEKFEETNGNAYIRIDKILTVQDMYSQMVAGITFLAMILFLKLLRYNRRVMGFSLMFKKCWDDLLGFGFIFAIFFLGFVSMFYVFFFVRLAEWNTFARAASTSFSIMLGKFDFSEIREANIVAAMFFFVFNLSMSVIMLNLMLCIIIMAFEEAEKEMRDAENELEVVGFIAMRARAFFGLRQAGASSVAPKKDKKDDAARKQSTQDLKDEQDVKEFPQKIDKMLDYVNSIYFDGNVDIHNKEWLKKFKKKNQGKVPSDWDLANDDE